MLSENSQEEKDKYHMFSFMEAEKLDYTKVESIIPKG
jgi:hypothetical protein